MGGSVAYCPQTAWIQNATLVSNSMVLRTTLFLYYPQRENITFGQPFEEDKVIIALIHMFVKLTIAKYWRAVGNASLLPDLQVLADGDLTEVSYYFIKSKTFLLNRF